MQEQPGRAPVGGVPRAATARRRGRAVVNDAIAAPRAILYDWDNTLVDSWGIITAAVNHTLTTFGLEPWTAVDARARIRKSLRDSFPALFGDRWTDARDCYYAYFAAHHLDHLRPMPGAEELLRDMAARGVYQAVVSNKAGHFLRAEADALGWTGWFGRLVGAQDAPFDKPHCAPVHLALEPAGLAAGPDVWFVGDTDIDMECAHAAGLVPVLVGLSEGDGDMPFQPTHRFATCHALHGLVAGGGATISLFTRAEAETGSTG